MLGGRGKTVPPRPSPEQVRKLTTDLGVRPQLFHIPCLVYINQSGFKGGHFLEETLSFCLRPQRLEPIPG